MAKRSIWLAKSRRSSAQRAHLSIFIPNEEYATMDPNNFDEVCLGTLINVVGATMLGYKHEFECNYDRKSSAAPMNKLVCLGSVDETLVPKPPVSPKSSKYDTGYGVLDQLAEKVPAPRISKNFMGPRDGINVRDCQNWIRDYVELLVIKNYLEKDALDIVDNEMDPPDHGIGLRKVKH